MGMICTCSMHCPLSGYHEKACCDANTCDCWCHTPGEHRGSRPGVDPLFYDAAFREFTPAEKKLVEEKLVDRARKAGGI